MATVRLACVALRKVSSSDQPASGLTQTVSSIASSTSGRLGGSGGSYVPLFGGANAMRGSPEIRSSKAEAVGPAGVAKETGAALASRAICSSTVASSTTTGTPYFAESAVPVTGCVPGVTATISAGSGAPPGGYL